jgi:predicted lipoprotein with Yx(FWY)xxD motif
MLQRLAALAGVLVLVTACGTTSSTGSGGYGPASTAPSPTAEDTDASRPPSPTSAPETPGPPPGTRVRVADSKFGPMLFATSGQAIYLFDKEEGTRPECYGACAVDWPPVLTDGEPRGVRGARQGLLGTTERRDGSVQVTYGGHPLYFYAHEDPWQVLCHDFLEYGGTWFVVQPDGEAAPPTA